MFDDYHWWLCMISSDSRWLWLLINDPHWLWLVIFHIVFYYDSDLHCRWLLIFEVIEILNWFCYWFASLWFWSTVIVINELWLLYSLMTCIVCSFIIVFIDELHWSFIRDYGIDELQWLFIIVMFELLWVVNCDFRLFKYV